MILIIGLVLRLNFSLALQQNDKGTENIESKYYFGATDVAHICTGCLIYSLRRRKRLFGLSDPCRFSIEQSLQAHSHADYFHTI